MFCQIADAEELFQVSRLEGHSFVTNSGASRELKSGDTLTTGDKVRVGPDSSLDIRLHGFAVNTVIVSKNTSFTVGARQAEALSLSGGSLEAQLTKLDGKPFGISTPVSLTSVLGTHFLISHADEVSQITVFKGSVSTTSKDLATGKMRENAAVITAGQRVEVTRIGLGPVNDVAMTTNSSAEIIKVNVDAAEKSYYIIPSCDLEDNISSCHEDDPIDAEKGDEQEEDYEDYTMFIGDGVAVPMRASLPWPESYLVISKGNAVLKFKGAMVVCIDYDAKNKRLIVKPFQARVETSVSTGKDGKTVITWTSLNKNGLKNSSVRVNEGAVAVTTPWMCESCLSTKTFLVEPGECFSFNYQPRESDLPDFELPPVLVNPPAHMDMSGSLDDE